MNTLVVTPMVKLRPDGLSWVVSAKVERDGEPSDFVMSQFTYVNYDRACSEARDWARAIKANYAKNNGYADKWHGV